MKALFIHSILIATLLTLVGCGSKENSVSLEVTSSFELGTSGYTGGLVVSGKNSIGQRFVKTTFGGSSLNVVLPDGAWDLSVVGWDGASPTAAQSPFSGTPYCGKTSINLAASDASVQVAVTAANCLTADFSGSPFVNAGIQEIHPLKIVTCGAFYNHVSGSSFTKLTAGNSNSHTSNFCNSAYHPMDLRSRTKSIKLIPIDKNFNGSYGGQPANNPFCLIGSDGVFNLSQQIPIAGLPIQVAFYEDTNCQEESSFVLFPGGLKEGYAPKFDSIVDHMTGDSNGPAVANRLIVPDNGINRGWSPFYNQMPKIKCSTGFCGDFVTGASSAKYTDGIFDYFMEVDYDGTINEPQQLVFPANSNICSAVIAGHPASVPGYTNYLDTPTCSYSVVDGKGQITLMVKPKISESPCLSELSDICHSPDQKFILLVDGVEKEIYFSGKKDYGGSLQPVPFSHLYVPVRQASVSSTCSAYSINNVASTGNNVLQPDLSCIFTTSPWLLAKAFYDTSTKTFLVEDSGANWGEVTFDDSAASMTKNLLMLPPEAREQRNLTNIIFETLGGVNWMESFKYENNNSDGDHGDESRAYGSIRRVREMFSPDGPGGLFGDSIAADGAPTCLSTVGTKQILHRDDDGFHNYEITVSNVSSTSTDPKHIRPAAYCDDVDYISPITCSTLNSGKYEKLMQIKKDGVPTEVILFDCAVMGNPSVPTQNGRLEFVNNEIREGKFQREKEIMYWNTYNQQYARFERYSRQMESSTSNFAIKSRDERIFEKVFKIGLLDQVHGRVYKYSQNTNPNNHNVTAARFQLYRPAAVWTYTYAFFDFHEPLATNLFAAPYSTLKADTFTDTHFCGNNFTFPQTFSYTTDCSSNNFVPLANEPAAVLGTFNAYQYMHGSYFDSLIGAGYFPISWP